METRGKWPRADRLLAATVKGDPFAAAIRATRMPIVITDPRQDDNPIVYANDSFLTLTGYARDEIIGRNCRFLQGPDTDSYAVAMIRAAIRDVRDVHVDLLNYRKDGSTFWNELYVSPIVDEKGELSFFFASQLDVSDRKRAEFEIQTARDHFELVSRERLDALARLQETDRRLHHALQSQTALLREVDHRVKHNLRIVSSLLLAQASAASDASIRRSLWDMLLRVESLASVRPPLCPDDVTRFSVDAYVRDLVTILVEIEGGGYVVAAFELASVAAILDQAAMIALVVSEFVVRALKHAVATRRTSTLTTKVERVLEKLRITILDDGRGDPAVFQSNSPQGVALIETLSRQLKANIATEADGTSQTVTIEFPIA